MSEAFQLITNATPEHNTTPPSRIYDTGLWTEIEADNLVDLLEDMDGLKHEIHERMRRIEAVKQAKSVLREDALRTEALNQELARIRYSLSQAYSAPTMRDDAGLLQMPAREAFSPTYTSRNDSPQLLEQSAQLEQYEETLTCEQARITPPPLTTASEPRAVDPSSVPVCHETIPEQLNSPADPTRFAQRSPSLSNSQMNPFTKELNAISVIATEASEAFRSATELIVCSEETRKLADKSILEARQLLEQSFTQLSHAIVKEEKAATELNSTQQELTTAYQFAAAAAQRQHNAAEFFRKTNHWTVNAAALAWVATIWTAWASFHTRMGIWEPCLATAAVMALAVIMARWSTRNDS